MTDATTHGRSDNRILAALPPDVLSLLQRDLRHVSIAQGAVIYEPGAALDTIYFPQSGLISLLIVTQDGGHIEAATVGREGAVGLHGALGQRRSFTRATAQIGGRFSTIGASRFDQILGGNGAVRDLIARYTEVLWAEAQQISACNAVHPAGARLCRWLLQSADRIGSDALPLTQEFLAQMLGVRRTTVTLLAQALQKDGIIKYSRGHIAILDRAALEQNACECYRVIHHHTLADRLGVKL